MAMIMYLQGIPTATERATILNAVIAKFGATINV
jgi:hypothetical protein